MIVGISGTSGSGKSTIVRRVMNLYPNRVEIPRGEDSKRPLKYVLHRDGFKPLSVFGHYETATGGCDTITTIRQDLRVMAKEWYDKGHDILFEGLIISAKKGVFEEIRDMGLPMYVALLDPPIEVCRAGIRQRQTDRHEARWAKWNADRLEAEAKGKKFSKEEPVLRKEAGDYVEGYHRQNRRLLDHLRAVKVPVEHFTDRELAFRWVAGQFGHTV